MYTGKFNVGNSENGRNTEFFAEAALKDDLRRIQQDIFVVFIYNEDANIDEAANF